MESPKAILSRVPLWFFFFIISGGLFFVLSFPFDIIQQDFSRFSPFVNIKYFDSEFPIGFVKIVLASLAVGTIMYLCNGIYQFVNHIPTLRGKLRECIGLKSTAPQDDNYEKNVMRYGKWLKTEGIEGYMNFIYSMEMVATGLLYGSETFFLVNLISFIFYAKIAYPTPLTCLLNSQYWTAMSLLIGLGFYIIFLSYKKSVQKANQAQWDAYRHALREGL